MSTEVKSPFSRPLAEIREGRVRTKFAEATASGNPELVLKRQRQAEQPDPGFIHGGSMVKAIMAALEAQDLIKLVLENADPMDDRWNICSRREILRRETLASLTPLALLAESGQAKQYAYYDVKDDQIREASELVLCEWNDQHSLHAVQFDGQGLASLVPPTTRDVFNVLLATWIHNGQRASKARRVICDAFAVWISGMRAKVEEEFAKAVAIRENGTSPLVDVDWVLVFEDNGRKLHLFPPASFRKHKIRLEDLLRKKLLLERVLTQDDALLIVPGAYRANSGIWADSHQTLIVGKSKDENKKGLRALITHTRYCPDPLPRGGISFNLPARRG